MAAGLAHEIRNPLNSASLQLTLLERRVTRGDALETTSPIIRIIKGEIERLETPAARLSGVFPSRGPLDVQPSTSGS